MKKIAICLILLMFLCVSCNKNKSATKSGELKTKLLYSYNFDEGKIGSDWKNEGGEWFVKDGTLRSTKAMNKDLVLTKPLPKDAVIEVDMISHSNSVDIKFRAWGDIRVDLHDGAYHFILGGWGNKISTIAPLGEHDKRRVELRQPLKPEHWYKAKLVRHNGKIELSLDGKPFMTFNDAEPLDPNVYKYFSFANWKTNCEFDNLKIYAIE